MTRDPLPQGHATRIARLRIVACALATFCVLQATPALATPTLPAVPASAVGSPAAIATLQPAPTGTLLFLGNEDLAPVVYLQAGAPSGLAVDLIRAMASHMPQPVEVRAMDWSQAQEIVASGQADALIQINPTPARMSTYDFSDPFLESHFSIFVRDSQQGISDMASLRGLRVGVEAGGAPQQILSVDSQIPLTIIPDFLSAFRMLAGGQIDAVVVDYRVGGYVLATNGIGGIKTAGSPIQSSYSAIAVQKGNAKLLGEIDAALHAIKADGTYDRILSQWAPTDPVFETQGQIDQRLSVYEIIALLILLLLTVAWVMSLRVQKARVVRSEQLELGRTRMLQAISAAASSSLSSAEVCERALEQVRSLPEAAAATIYLLDDERKTLRNLAIFGYPDDMLVLTSELPVDDSTNPGRVAAHDLSMLTHEDPGDPSSARLAHMGVPSARWIALPIKSAGRLIGVIALIFHGERSFSPREITLLTGIADSLAAPLDNARLFEAERQATERAEASEGEARNLIRYAPTGIYEIDFRGPRFMSVNDAMCELTGYSRQELFAKSPFDLLDEPSRALFQERMAKTLAGSTPADEVEYTAIRKDGRHVSIVLDVSFRHDPEGHVSSALVVGHDVTELVDAKRQATQELSRTRLLSEVALAASSSVSFVETAQAALAALRRHLDLSMGDIRALDEQGHRLRMVASFGYPLDLVTAQTDVEVEDSRLLSAMAVKEARVVTHEDEHFTPERFAVVKAAGVAESRYAVLPMVIRDAVVGTLALTFDGQRPFTADEMELFGSIAGTLAQAIENARLFEAESEARQVASDELNAANVLLHAAGELNQHTDLSSLLDALVGLILRLVPGRVNIGLAAKDGSSMTMAASGGQRPYPRGAVVPWDSLTSGARAAMETGRTKIVDFEQLEEGGIANEYGSRLALFVALKFGDRTVGQIGMDVPEQRHDFTPRVIALVEGIASQAAVAIENVRLFEDVRIHAERAEVLKELAEIGVTGGSVNDVAERQAQAVVRLLGASNAAVIMSDGERLQPVALVGYPDEYVEKLTPMPEDSLAAQAFRSGEARFVTDLHASDVSEFTRTVSSALGFGSFAALPLGPSEAPLGAVGFVWPETRLFDHDEVSFLEAVASELAAGLNNKRAQDKLGESEEQFRSLAESIPNLAWWANGDGYITWYNRRWYEYTGTTPEQMEGWGWQSVHDPEVLPAVLERWTASIATGQPLDMEFPLRGADGVFRTFLTRVEPLRDSSGRAIRWFGTNTDISAIKETEEALRASEARFRFQFETMSEGFSINEIVLDDQGKPCDLRYIDVNPAFEAQTGLRAADILGRTMLELFPDAETDWFERYGNVALTGVPDQWEARFGPLDKWFAVSSYQIEPGRFAVVFFDITERKAAEEALHALYESERESARLSDALNGVNRAVHSSLETDEVMQHALDAGVQALGCDAAAIEMREGEDWVVRYQTGFSPQDVGTRLSEQEAPNAARVALEVTPIQVEFMPGDEKLNVGFVKKYSLKSVLAVPLFAKGNVIGCALFYTSNEARCFTDAEVDFAQKLGSVVSLGLENARLYAIERNTALTLQRALLTLPESIRDIDFASSYRAATESTLVGGDFYDLFELDDDRIGITIGDISGKGLGAAVLTSLVKDTIRAHANERTKTPAQVLTLTNDLVYKSTPTEVFATVFFGILDRRDGRMSFASAGHTVAAIVKGGGLTSKLAAADPILGAFPSVRFREAETEIGTGELLFLYTDGLTEAHRGVELYGEARLFDLLSASRHESASEVVAEVMDDVLSFAAGHLRDDLAILAVRRSESGEQPDEP